MAKKIVPDPPRPTELQISAQDDLLHVHYKVRTLLNTMLNHVNLNEYTACDMYEYLCVVSDFSDQAISMLQQMIRRTYEIDKEDHDVY